RSVGADRSHTAGARACPQRDLPHASPAYAALRLGGRSACCHTEQCATLDVTFRRTVAAGVAAVCAARGAPAASGVARSSVTTLQLALGGGRVRALPRDPARRRQWQRGE